MASEKGKVHLKKQIAYSFLVLLKTCGRKWPLLMGNLNEFREKSLAKEHVDDELIINGQLQ